MSERAISIEAYGEDEVAELEYCEHAFRELERHYPGHRWEVEAILDAGVVNIKLPYLAASQNVQKWGFRLHIASLKSHDGMRKVRNAGGELLERYGLPRTGFRDGDHLKAAEHGLDVTGAD